MQGVSFFISLPVEATRLCSGCPQGSPICDVLGPSQRRWLQRELSSSHAPLRIVASGSVPFGSLGYQDDPHGGCSGDDWQVGVVWGEMCE